MRFEATMASKQPRRSDLTSDLKFMAQTTYPTMFVWTVLALFGPNGGKKKEERKNPLTSTRVVGFAAPKNLGRFVSSLRTQNHLSGNRSFFFFFKKEWCCKTSWPVPLNRLDTRREESLSLGRPRQGLRTEASQEPSSSSSSSRLLKKDGAKWFLFGRASPNSQRSPLPS